MKEKERSASPGLASHHGYVYIERAELGSHAQQGDECLVGPGADQVAGEVERLEVSRSYLSKGQHLLRRAAREALAVGVDESWG